MGNFRKHSPRVFWSEAEVNILMEHYPSLSAAELLEKLPGRTIRVIQCKANGLGLSRTKPKKRTAEQTREAKRKHMAERWAENPEAMRAVSRNFHRKHKERINAQRRGHHVTRLFWTRALRFRGVTASDLAKLWKAQRGAVISGLAAIDRLMPELSTWALAAGALQLDQLLASTAGMGTADIRRALGMRAA